VCSTKLLSTWSTDVHQSQTSQPTSFADSHSTSPDRTTLPAQHFRSSCLLCCRSDGLELATGQSLSQAAAGAVEPRDPGGQLTPHFFRCGVHIRRLTPHSSFFHTPLHSTPPLGWYP